MKLTTTVPVAIVPQAILAPWHLKRFNRLNYVSTLNGQDHSPYPTWKQVTLFGVVGPPVGALAILLWSRFAGEPPLRFDLGAWLFFVFPIAYLYAGVPALLTGYTAALARRLTSGPTWGALAFRFVVPVAVGAGASVLFSLFTITSEPSAVFATLGAFAALVCTLIVEWRAVNSRQVHHLEQG